MPASKLANKEFGTWRTYLWPVHRFELKKLIPLLLIFFFINFDYNVLRTMKDTLVINARGSGAEALPFIKVWAMFPTSILMTFIFTRLSNRYSFQNVVYVMFSAFLLFFFVFAFFLYPMQDVLHPHASADYLQSVLPPGFKGFIAMYRNWTFTMFYVMSELWGNIVLFVLFWGYANQITQLGEAKRFYGILGMGANFSGIFAGQVSAGFYREHVDPSFPLGSTGWEQTMIILISLVLIAGLIAIGLLVYMNKKVLTNPLFYNQEVAKQERSSRGKLSLRESFSYLVRSKYLMSLAFIVIAYNVVINLVEILWKHQVHEFYPNPADYNLYMSHITTIIGGVATISALLISGNSLRKFGWTFTAMLTPIILLATSVLFMSCFIAKESLTYVVEGFLGSAPLAMAVFFGSLQNVMSRAAKYSVFDASKEMAYVPLSPESKIKGKAAIDGVAARLGKSGGSVIHQGLLVIFSSFATTAPIIAVCLFAIICLWMFAVRLMGRQFNQLIDSKGTAPIVTADSNNSQPASAITDSSLTEQKAV